MTQRNLKAFTLIELLVVISIIALLIGILLPALGTARATALSIVDQTQLRSIAQGQALYSLSNEEYYAGPNTSGWGDVPGENQSEDRYVFNTSSTTPVQTFDWISPILGEELGFSPNRAERFGNIFNDFADPSVRIFNDTVYTGSGASADIAELQEYFTGSRGYKQASYLSPFAMHAWPEPQFRFGTSPPSSDAQVWSDRYGGVPYNWDYPDVTHPGARDPDHRETNFRPRTDRVGPVLSEKVIAMNGTRYLDGRILDFDNQAVPGTFGGFTEGTPQYIENTAYGTSGPGGGLQRELSFRHIGESINMAFFDGHVQNADIQETMERVDWFFPSGMKIGDTRNLDPITRRKWETNQIIP